MEEERKMNRTFQKNHCLTVILGLTPRPIPHLFSSYRRNGVRPTVIAYHIPMLLLLFPFARFYKIPRYHVSEMLYLELTAFSERNRDKKLTLVPATAEMRRFVEQYRERLETDYILCLSEGETV